MITIISKKTHTPHKPPQITDNHSAFFELCLTITLFGSMGAITWAIRGTAGWGGVDGTVLPGMTWGLLWYYICYRNGLDARGIVLWLGLGIALGGELGYGQYVSWIQGRFHAGENILPISPWIGYRWFFLCGIGWAAPGGILLGWALSRATVRMWIVRSLLLVLLLFLLFAWPLVDRLGQVCLRLCPDLLFPHADLGLYSGELDKHLSRTVYTNTQNFFVFIWWLAALTVAAIGKDRVTLTIGSLLGFGFGLGFMQSALWCIGYSYAPNYMDWWKMWELNAGFNLGVLYALALFWARRNLYSSLSKNEPFDKSSKEDLSFGWQKTIFLAFAGGLLIFFIGFEYFFYTGLFLTLFYTVATLFTMSGKRRIIDSNTISERQKSISLIFSIFLLLFLLFHGGSERAGILLGLYQAEAVDQYAWPSARIFLFAPFAILIVGVALYKMWRIMRNGERVDRVVRPLSRPEYMIDLMTLIGFIGALSIWPAKIGVLYAFFIFLALFAFCRLERFLNNTG